jgi:aldose 1-epimerase
MLCSWRSEDAGTLPDGRHSRRYTLRNLTGATVKILDYGGIVQSISVPDSFGECRNVALGFSSLSQYLDQTRYFGAIIGRSAGRILGGDIALEGGNHRVSVNSPPHSKHGGFSGFDKKLWSSCGIRDADSVGVRLEYISPDGEEGYPGTLRTTVTYRLLRSASTLRVDYRATTDKETVVNLTNHTYFNLAGEGQGDVLDHELIMGAESYLPIGPEGESLDGLKTVKNTALDFSSSHRIGERIRDSSTELIDARGYDHQFKVQGDPGQLNFAARVLEPLTRRTLELWTTEPCLVFYTGNLLDGSVVGSSGSAYRQSDGFALEPKRFMNPAHTPLHPSWALLPNEIYQASTEYRFDVI